MITPQMHDAARLLYGPPGKPKLGKFRYYSDSKVHGGEHWEFYPEPIEGKVRGDCDNALTYMIGLLTNFEPGAAERGIKSETFRCHRVVHEKDGSGHIRLEYNGQFICNISKVWQSKVELPGYRYDKVRTWGQIRLKLAQGWARENKSKALLLLIGAAALAAAVLFRVS